MARIEEDQVTQKLNLGIWKKLFRYLTDFKRDLLLLIGLMTLVAGMDAVMPLLTGYAIDNLVVKDSTNKLTIFALMYFAVVTFQAINVKLFIKHSGKLENYLAYHIRKLGFKRLQELSFSYYDTSSSGWLMARMTSDVARLSELISWGMTA